MTKVKVTFYRNSNESSIDYKWFKTWDEANDWSQKYGLDKIAEKKEYEIPDHYPPSELDMT